MKSESDQRWWLETDSIFNVVHFLFAGNCNIWLAHHRNSDDAIIFIYVCVCVYDDIFCSGYLTKSRCKISPKIRLLFKNISSWKCLNAVSFCFRIIYRTSLVSSNKWCGWYSHHWLCGKTLIKGHQGQSDGGGGERIWMYVCVSSSKLIVKWCVIWTFRENSL